MKMAVLYLLVASAGNSTPILLNGLDLRKIVVAKFARQSQDKGQLVWHSEEVPERLASSPWE